MLVLDSILGSKNSSAPWEGEEGIWARATEWVVGTGGSTDSGGEDSGLGEGNYGSERKEGEHLCRFEELVLPKYVKPHQG